MFSRIATRSTLNVCRTGITSNIPSSTRFISLSIQKPLFTAEGKATGGGRADGHVKSSSGSIQAPIQPPGKDIKATNPEELYVLAHSACFLGAMRVGAQKIGKTIGGSPEVRGEATLGETGSNESPFFITTKFTVTDKNTSLEDLKAIAEHTHKKVCPYSLATQNNVQHRFHIIAKDGEGSF